MNITRNAKRFFACMAAAGAIGAVAVPTIAIGNARRTEGTLASLRSAEKPYIAQLSGAAERPGPGDPDGKGAASVSIDSVDATTSELCFDMSYSAISAPAAAHIHRGAAGAAGPVVIDLGIPGALASSGCVDVTAVLADEIIASPSSFYVNVHNADYLAGAIRGQLAAGPDSAGATFLLPSPLRAYDSRDVGTAKLAAGSTTTVSLATGALLDKTITVAVPPGATGAIVTLTGVNPDGSGFLKLYSAATPEPATSNLNFAAAGGTTAVSTQVAVDATGSVKVTVGPSAAHVIVDVIGYFY
jgi:CHRD domain